MVGKTSKVFIFKVYKLTNEGRVYTTNGLHINVLNIDQLQDWKLNPQNKQIITVSPNNTNYSINICLFANLTEIHENKNKAT